MTTIASFVGASLGIVILTLFAPKLSEVALAFGPATTSR
jgi:TctA family transporter